MLLSCLVALFVVDLRCSIPALVYGSLLAISAVQVLFMLNEGAILVLSGRGSIWQNTHPRKHITKLIFVRALIAVLEFCVLVVASITVWLRSTTEALLACPSTSAVLHVTRAVTISMWIVYMFFLLKVLIYVDPIGCFSPGLLEHISFLDSSLEQVTEDTDSGPVTMATSSGKVLLTKQVSYWVSTKDQYLRRIGRGERVTAERVGVHKIAVSQSKIRRRLGVLFCCLCIRDKRSVGVALEEVARGFYTIFGDTENHVVLTDIIAGLRLVHHDQKNNPDLTEKFRKVHNNYFCIVTLDGIIIMQATFRMMPGSQRYGLDPETIRKDGVFDWENEVLPIQRSFTHAPG